MKQTAALVVLAYASSSCTKATSAAGQATSTLVSPSSATAHTVLEREGFEALLAQLQVDSTLQVPAIDGRDFCRRQKPAVQAQCKRNQEWAALLYEGLKKYSEQMRTMPLDEFEQAQRRLSVLGDRLWQRPHWGNVLLADWITKVQIGRLLHRAVHGPAEEVRQLDAMRALVHDHRQEWRVVALALQREHNTPLNLESIESGAPNEESSVTSLRRRGHALEARYEAIHQILWKRKVWNEKQLEGFFGLVVPVLSPVQIALSGYSWQFLILAQRNATSADRPSTRDCRLYYALAFLERLRVEAPYKDNAAEVTTPDKDLAPLVRKAIPHLLGHSQPGCPKGPSSQMIKSDLALVNLVQDLDQGKLTLPGFGFEITFGLF